LIANQDQRTEEDHPGHQEVGKNWHSHRLAPTKNCVALWLIKAKRSVSQITTATKKSRPWGAKKSGSI